VKLDLVIENTNKKENISEQNRAKPDQSIEMNWTGMKNKQVNIK
jgi:hypothetical protein